jgi:hypothetical protein
VSDEVALLDTIDDARSWSELSAALDRSADELMTSEDSYGYGGECFSRNALDTWELASLINQIRESAWDAGYQAGSGPFAAANPFKEFPMFGEDKSYAVELVR